MDEMGGWYTKERREMHTRLWYENLEKEITLKT